MNKLLFQFRDSATGLVLCLSSISVLLQKESSVLGFAWLSSITSKLITMNNQNHNQAGSFNSTGHSVGNASGSQDQATPPVVMLNKQRLQELVNEIDPCEQLEDDVEEALLQMADDFIDSVVTSACQMAKHRNSKTLEVKDVQLVLEKDWNINIPGFGHPLTSLNRLKSHSATTEAHKQRLALIKKTLKKM